VASEDKNEWIGVAFLGIGLGCLGAFGGLAAASATMGNGSIPLWFGVIAGGVLLGKSPIALALAKRVADAKDPDAIENHEAMYEELDEVRGRLNELFERQEFSERLLASKKDEIDSAGVGAEK
jgi:hypothetical protein